MSRLAVPRHTARADAPRETIGGVNDYMVAAHTARYRSVSQDPQGKRHAYRSGASTTACGFGLDAMQRFANLRFNLQAPELRCPLCARLVGANH
jgi:hypothetical protein